MWTQNELDRVSRYHFETEHDFISTIKELSVLFTVKREQIDVYVKSNKLVSAYTRYYMPTNMPKFSFIWEQLSEEVQNLISLSPFIDIGTGPGTYIWSFLKLNPSFNKQIYGVDNSSLMLEQGDTINKLLMPENDIKWQNYLPNIKNSTLCFGNSLNEIGVNLACNHILELSPSVIIFLSLGTKSSFRDMLLVRERIIKFGYKQEFPCLIEVPCPMSEDDWCHQVLKTTHSDELERLSQLAGLDRKSMPMISHIFIRSDKLEKKKNLDGARLVQIVDENKFAFNCTCCRPSSLNELDLIKLELLKKGMNKKEIKEFRRQSVGKLVEYYEEKKLKNEAVRGVLKHNDDL